MLVSETSPSVVMSLAKRPRFDLLRSSKPRRTSESPSALLLTMNEDGKRERLAAQHGLDSRVLTPDVRINEELPPVRSQPGTRLGPVNSINAVEHGTVTTHRNLEQTLGVTRRGLT